MLTARVKHIISICIIILSMPLGMLLAEIFRTWLGISNDGPYIMIFSYVVMFSVMALVCYSIKSFLPSLQIGYYNNRFGLTSLYVLLGVILLIAWNIVISPASKYLPSAGNEQLEQILDTGVLSVITAIVIAPFFEEWFFRGILLNNFKLLSNSKLFAVIFSALLFGLSHGYPLQAVTAFGAGVILGSIYIKTKSLLSVGTIHLLYNGIIYLLYVINPEQEEIVSPSPMVWSIAFIIILIPILLSIIHREKDMDW